MVWANGADGALAAYRAVATIDAAPEHLMRTAIEAVLRFLSEAELAITGGDRSKRARALSAAARIIEFLLGLSGNEPGPLSERLARLYRFALAAILTANAAENAEAVAAARLAIGEIALQWRRLFPDPIC